MKNIGFILASSKNSNHHIMYDMTGWYKGYVLFLKTDMDYTCTMVPLIKNWKTS